MSFRTASLVPFVLTLFLQCTDRDTQHIMVNFRGETLTEEQVETMKKEIPGKRSADQANIYKPVELTRYDDVNKSLPDWIPKRDTQISGGPKLEAELIIPYCDGRLPWQQLAKKIDKLDDDTKQLIPFYFSKIHCPRLKRDKTFLQRILALDQRVNHGEYEFLIGCTQQLDGFQKITEDYLADDQTYLDKFRQPIGLLLSRHAAAGDHSRTLALLDVVVRKLPAGQVIDLPGENYLDAFEYLILNGDEKIRTQTKKLLFQYLGKADFQAAKNEHALIAREISDDFKKVIGANLNSVNAITDPEYRKPGILSFENFYLLHYARNYGMASISFITNMVNEKIPNTSWRYQALLAIKELITYNKLSEQDKLVIQTLLRNPDILGTGHNAWALHVEIFKLLYPDKPFSEASKLLPGDAQLLEAQWNKRKYSVYDLDTYLGYLHAAGFDTQKITALDRFLFVKEYEYLDTDALLWAVLDMTTPVVQYDGRGTQWPNPYDELTEKYLSACRNDLKNYYALYRPGESVKGKATKYTAMITNGTKAYLVEPEHPRDCYDPITIEAMLNTALREHGQPKRFVKVNTPDHTVVSVYCKPDQLKLFADQSGLSLVD